MKAIDSTIKSYSNYLWKTTRLEIAPGKLSSGESVQNLISVKEEFSEPFRHAPIPKCICGEPIVDTYCPACHRSFND